MAEPLKYEIPKPNWTVTRSADDELRELIELLHQRGVLRLVNSLLASLPSVAKVMLDGIDNRAGSNAIQNLSALIELIGRMPPEQFRRVCLGVTLALRTAGDAAERGDNAAPGLKGAVRLLHDDELWRALGPLLQGARSFGAALARDTDRSPHAGPHAGER